MQEEIEAKMFIDDHERDLIQADELHQIHSEADIIEKLSYHEENE